ncbi:UAP56-interacting factor-like isoform X3 [Phaenicophaeus curvirostris]|uniref:UAP56-interacting factor-like isoform X3 n=1 Tax=Phaenicophaeus curvirostris TaxID=33595 RepID=UPI0037F099CD
MCGTLCFCSLRASLGQTFCGPPTYSIQNTPYSGQKRQLDNKSFSEDLVLLPSDDIIKRHRKEQTDASTTGDRRSQQVKNGNSAYGYGRPRFRAWMQRNLQGPNRFRRGFGQQQYNRRQFRNTLPGPRRRASAALNGVSPLNRQASAQEGNKNNNAFSKSSASGQLEGRQRPPPGPKRFRAAAASTQAPGKSRPFLLNRGPPFQQKRTQQRFSKSSFRRGMDANGEAKPPRMRRWQVKPSPGAVLTVSVANPQAGQIGAPGSKRPFLRSQRPPLWAAKPQPKGVLLRFNFRAMANQTSLTLDERFSGLRNKRRFTAARSANRTVTMP